MTNEALLSLLHDLSLDEKIGQMIQLMADFYDENGHGTLTGPALDQGLEQAHIALAGSILGSFGAEKMNAFQKKYMDQHPHHIPMLFMMDVIHGLRTVFPNPLGLGATFDPELARKCAEVIARESAVSGIHVTFAPMADLVRDARWGRVLESTGEDPWLNSRFAEAFVLGLQGDKTDWHDHICACVKHFAAYGAPTAGRDYNTVELSEHTLREFYFPAYQAGIQAGSELVMTSFNTVNGIPASTNAWLLKTILRKEMGFDGVLISDFASITETVAHGHAENKQEAARMAMHAGLDIDMMGGAYASSLKKLLAEGEITEEQIDEAVLRILKLKNKLGLFEHPFKDADAEREKAILLCDAHRDLARQAARESIVLLKNDGILPLKKNNSLAFIGPYAESGQLLSSWSFTGKEEDCVTVRQAAEETLPRNQICFHAGCAMLSPGTVLAGFDGIDPSLERKPSDLEKAAMLQKAVEAAARADTVILLIGEHWLQSGEATSRTNITIPDIQMELFRAIYQVNPRIVTVVFSGRPLDLREISDRSCAVLEAWRPGTEGGHAILDVLTGAYNPSGCLPMSFPYCVGQVPIHYNEYATGRPDQPGKALRFASKYIDAPNAPLYPFGFGLSYTTYDLSPVTLSSDTLRSGSAIHADVTVTNTGKFEGKASLQLYLRDLSASVVRPVKELKGIEKIRLAPGESKKVSFPITEDMLRFHRADGSFGSEPGKFMLWIGLDSTTDNCTMFSLLD